jgi:hypothetical protein
MASHCRWLGLFLSVSVLSGCWRRDSFPEMFDDWLFRMSGGTLFSNPERLSLKEIHLDNGMLTGRLVIVEGVVEGMSDLGTYLVMSDHSARLLVVLTDVDHMPFVQIGKRNTLNVLGKVESGKKGLPFVRAFSVRVLPDADGVGVQTRSTVGSVQNS